MTENGDQLNITPEEVRSQLPDMGDQITPESDPAQLRYALEQTIAKLETDSPSVNGLEQFRDQTSGEVLT